MPETSRLRSWIAAALLAGIAYLVVGRLFATPTSHVEAWRLAAWVASGVVFAAHIGYEHAILRQPPRLLAAHCALGVAMGALGLAVAGMIHSLSRGAGHRSLWLIALVAWPAVTAIPAFVVALLAGTLLARRHALSVSRR